MSNRLIAVLCESESRRDLITAHLQAANVKLSACSSCDELYRLSQSTRIDTLIVEHNLPGFVTGLDLVARWKSRSSCPQTLILGDLNQEELARARSLGVCSVLAANASDIDIAKAVSTHGVEKKATVNIPLAAERLAENVNFIRPLPQTVVRIIGFLNDPDASLADLSKEISSDARLTIELLKLVNSSAMGVMRKIQKVSDAIGLIGLKRTAALVVSSCMLGPANHRCDLLLQDMERCQRIRRLLIAAGAYTYATMTGHASPDTVQIVALLQDLGIFVMAYKLGRPYLYLYERSRTVMQIQRAHAEHEELGYTHADVSAALLEQWNMPRELIELVHQHHRGLTSSDDACGDAGFYESLQFGEALADLREQTSVSRTLELQRRVEKWGRMDLSMLRNCLAQCVQRIQEQGSLFRSPVPDASELQRLTAHGRMVEEVAEGIAAS